jgi:hypothetical protein
MTIIHEYDPDDGEHDELRWAATEQAWVDYAYEQRAIR